MEETNRLQGGTETPRHDTGPDGVEIVLRSELLKPNKKQIFY